MRAAEPRAGLERRRSRTAGEDDLVAVRRGGRDQFRGVLWRLLRSRLRTRLLQPRGRLGRRRHVRAGATRDPEQRSEDDQRLERAERSEQGATCEQGRSASGATAARDTDPAGHGAPCWNSCCGYNTRHSINLASIFDRATVSIDRSRWGRADESRSVTLRACASRGRRARNGARGALYRRSRRFVTALEHSQVATLAKCSAAKCGACANAAGHLSTSLRARACAGRRARICVRAPFCAALCAVVKC